ncbi:Aste57867_18195 [Aphanomyces stellatus]|uniref:Aste57867_18195 protein n=1 Tax=Aphanomyces stellatus TaxID=120398 RepID=A0A485L9F5_9STRA|nr:hypothetical protein As57867_018133 [Aphanomyces stellatus]VFT94933.1 Aste57867_18195 [Aphanomyces stellatus]
MMAVEAIEAHFVRGELEDSLRESREWLTQQLHLNAEVVSANTNLVLLGNEISIATDTGLPIDDDIERVFAVYIQSAFELNAPDEVLLIADTLRLLSPLPFHIGLYWGSFLVAMGQSDEAERFLLRTLEVLKPQTSSDRQIARQFSEMFHVLLTKIWIPNVSDPVALVQRVQTSGGLTETSKAKFIQLIQAQHKSKDEPASVSTRPSPPRESKRLSQSSTKQKSADQSSSNAASILTDPSTQMMIGAAAVAAVCAIKYRSHLNTSVSDIMTTLNDVKGLFFG